MHAKIIYIFLSRCICSFHITYLTVLYILRQRKECTHGTDCTDYGTDSDITSLNKEARSDLKHYYQTDDRNIDGYFFYKAASPMAVEEICIMKATIIPRQILWQNANIHLLLETGI